MKPLRSTLPDLPDSLLLRLIGTLALALLVAMAAGGGAFRSFEDRLDEITFAVFEQPASGQVQLVEMDAASMAAIRPAGPSPPSRPIPIRCPATASPPPRARISPTTVPITIVFFITVSPFGRDVKSRLGMETNERKDR